MNTYRI
ncbi:hypothetical protein CP02DC22_0725A, partial [Chlamydia psittaci 02DC22]